MFGPNQQGVKHLFRVPRLFVQVEQVGAMAFPVPTGPIVPAVPATVVGVFHPVIRIGPERHSYVYRLHSNSGWYLCDRRSEWGSVGDRLFLFMNPEGPGP